MRKSYKGKLWKRIGIGGIFLLVTVAVGIAFYEYQLRKRLEGVYEEVNKKLLFFEEANVWYSGKEDLRQIFISEAELAEHLETGDRIDVRIRYANAEDYLILSDKALVKCEKESGMVLELSEEEILFLSSAISDSDMYEGTKLYAVEYPEYQKIQAGEVTYIPNKNILRMIGRETTKGESRIALEQRLEQKNQ